MLLLFCVGQMQFRSTLRSEVSSPQSSLWEELHFLTILFEQTAPCIPFHSESQTSSKNPLNTTLRSLALVLSLWEMTPISLLKMMCLECYEYHDKRIIWMYQRLFYLYISPILNPHSPPWILCPARFSPFLKWPLGRGTVLWQYIT